MNYHIRQIFLRYINSKKLMSHSRLSRNFSAKELKSIRYFTKDRVAHIELNRPDRLNAINKYMPFEIQNAVQKANFDDDVHAILIYGAGNAFCAGYDLKSYAEESDSSVGEDGDFPDYVNQDMP